MNLDNEEKLEGQKYALVTIIMLCVVPFTITYYVVTGYLNYTGVLPRLILSKEDL